MPMNKTVLGALMVAKVDALSDSDKADKTKTFEALAEAVILHITQAAVISGTCVGLIAPPGTGGGPVTGVASLPAGSIT
jgi:hypothetical protein